MKYMLIIIGFVLLCSSYVFAAETWHSGNKTGTFVADIICIPGSGCSSSSVSGNFGTWFTGTHDLTSLIDDQRRIVFFVSDVSRKESFTYTVKVQSPALSDAELWYDVSQIFDTETSETPIESKDNTGTTETNVSGTHLAADPTDLTCNHTLTVLVRANQFKELTPTTTLTWTITFTCSATTL